MDPKSALESPAVQLFVNRAKAAVASFELTAANAPAVAELCVRLDGLPLALELAAARSPLLPPPALLARLGHRLDLLADGASDLPPRQRSVRAAIGYSYDLLTLEEQTLFRQLAIFAGGCTADAAAAVALTTEPPVVGDAFPNPADRGFGPIVGRLAGLVQKSLLSQEPQADGDIRFRMLETVRAYAAERLVAGGEMAATRQYAIGYYTALAERAQSGLRGRDQAAWLALLDCEHDNMRAVLTWCLESGEAEDGLNLAGRLGRFWELRGLYSEGRKWLIDLLALSQPAQRTPARARALSAAGDLAASQGDDVGAEAYESESLAICRELEDREGIAASLSALGLLAHRRGDAARARAMLEESLAVSRELGDQWAIASVLHHLGDVASEPGQYPIARARYEESLIQWHALEDIWGVAMCLESMGCLAQARGQAARALHLIGAGAAARDSVRSSLKAPVQRLRLQETITAAENALGSAATATALAAGRAMSLDEAVLCARAVQDHTAPQQPAPLPADSPLAWLTRREQEVSTLLLRGLSNRQIAEELVITERTAETHVCRILSKLGLGSRAQIAAWVMDRSVVKDRRVFS
jgi:non-specific serine/threonine protein kinase